MFWCCRCIWLGGLPDVAARGGRCSAGAIRHLAGSISSTLCLLCVQCAGRRQPATCKEVDLICGCSLTPLRRTRSCRMLCALAQRVCRVPSVVGPSREGHVTSVCYVHSLEVVTAATQSPSCAAACTSFSSNGREQMQTEAVPSALRTALCSPLRVGRPPRSSDRHWVGCQHERDGLHDLQGVSSILQKTTPALSGVSSQWCAHAVTLAATIAGRHANNTQHVAVQSHSSFRCSCNVAHFCPKRLKQVALESWDGVLLRVLLHVGVIR